MKKNFLLVISLLSSISYCQTHNDSIICWKKEILKQTDFKAKVPDSTGHQVALSYIEITTNAHWSQGIPKYKINAVFKKYRSWLSDTSVSVLKHEQLHFDISEIYARKMRKAVFDLREKGDTCIIDYVEVLTTLAKECIQTNEKYDIETAHGTYSEKQKEWYEEIYRKLHEPPRNSTSGSPPLKR